MGGGRGGFGAPNAETLPAEYRGWLGRITDEKTMPQLKKFVESGGTIVTIGSSTSSAEVFGIPVKNYLTEIGPDGKEHPLPREKFFIPGSLLKVNVDNTNPLAYGMPAQVDVFFDSSPVMKLEPNAELKHTSAVAWFSGPNVLDSGWAWGQQYLDGGTAVAEASVGEGKVVLLGPEVDVPRPAPRHLQAAVQRPVLRQREGNDAPVGFPVGQASRPAQARAGRPAPHYLPPQHHARAIVARSAHHAAARMRARAA